MSQRLAYHAPPTPIFNVDTTSEQSAIPRQPDGSPRIGSTSASPVACLTPHHQPSPSRPANSDADYFPGFDTSKFPPSQFSNGHARPSSVHVPLLSGTDDDDDDGKTADANTMGLTRPAHRRTRSHLISYFTPRSRLHPIMLFPAFVVGVFLAMTGLFGPTMHPLVNTYTSIRGGKSRRPDYTMHESGHLFLSPSALDPSSDNSPIPASIAAWLPKGIHHPIHDLVANATRDWENKLARQSKTLEAAVKEYKRRHGRKPPKGFDDWFRFAQANDVVLIDEFDQTLHDVLPFYAMPAYVIEHRAMQLQRDASTFTMRIKDGKNEIIGAHKDDGRAKDQAELMKRWTKWVPDVNITMSAHDGPSIMMDEQTRTQHVEAAKRGRLLTGAELDQKNDDAAFWGFPLACPPGSRLRRSYDGLELGALPPGPSYVANHLKTMDMCDNPEWQYLHGFTAWPGARPSVLRPLFSFAKTTMHSDILLTPLEQFWDYEQWDPEWDKKPNNKAIWRGTTTGVWFDRGTWWRSSQRMRLWFMGKDKTGHRRVRFDQPAPDSGLDSVIERNMSTAVLMDRYIDFAFTGHEGQCSDLDGSCAAVKKLIDFKQPFGWNEANEFKYALDIDGNAWSGRFHRLLSSNSAILKSTIFPEWYASWIQPWVHYIPVKVDYTDLFDIMAFFSGDLEGKNGHEEMAKKIAAQGKEYTAKHWRYADMEAYFFRLALEWARCSAPDRESMDYEGP